MSSRVGGLSQGCKQVGNGGGASEGGSDPKVDSDSSGSRGRGSGSLYNRRTGIKPASHFTSDRRKNGGPQGSPVKSALESRVPSLRYLTPKVGFFLDFFMTLKFCTWLFFGVGISVKILIAGFSTLIQFGTASSYGELLVIGPHQPKYPVDRQQHHAMAPRAGYSGAARGSTQPSLIRTTRSIPYNLQQAVSGPPPGASRRSMVVVDDDDDDPDLAEFHTALEEEAVDAAVQQGVGSGRSRSHSNLKATSVRPVSTVAKVRDLYRPRSNGHMVHSEHKAGDQNSRVRHEDKFGPFAFASAFTKHLVDSSSTAGLAGKGGLSASKSLRKIDIKPASHFTERRVVAPLEPPIVIPGGGLINVKVSFSSRGLCICFDSKRVGQIKGAQCGSD